MMHQAAPVSGSAVMQRLLEGIEDETCLCRPGDAPTDDAPGEGVDDERHVNEALPGAHIGVSRPEESHLRPLAEPDVSLSAHPAPAIRPMTETPVTNERTHPVAFAPA